MIDGSMPCAVPLAFRIREYVNARHDEMVDMIRSNEEKRLRVASAAAAAAGGS